MFAGEEAKFVKKANELLQTYDSKAASQMLNVHKLSVKAASYYVALISVLSGVLYNCTALRKPDWFGEAVSSSMAWYYMNWEASHLFQCELNGGVDMALTASQLCPPMSLHYIF